MKKVIYVAGPFRAVNRDGSPDMFRVQQNVMRAMALGLEVWKRGAVALVPHGNTWCYTGAAGLPDEVWLDGDLELVRRSDAVLLAEDWARSRGAYQEQALAHTLNLPVFYTLQQLDDWLRDKSADDGTGVR